MTHQKLWLTPKRNRNSMSFLPDLEFTPFMLSVLGITPFLVFFTRFYYTIRNNDLLRAVTFFSSRFALKKSLNQGTIWVQNPIKWIWLSYLKKSFYLLWEVTPTQKSDDRSKKKIYTWLDFLPNFYNVLNVSIPRNPF